jgi:hypothetical protein
MRIFRLLLPLLFIGSVVGAQQPPYTALSNFTATAVSISPTVNLTNSGTVFHQLTYNVTGAVSSCLVSLDSSPDGVTWAVGGVIPASACTATGQTVVIGANVNFVRMNVTSFTGTGRVALTYAGYATNPGGGGGGGVTAITSLDNSITMNQSTGAVDLALNTGQQYLWSTLQQFGAGFEVTSGQIMRWSNNTGLSTPGAGIVDVGNGTQGSTTGSLNLTNVTASNSLSTSHIIGTGTKPTFTPGTGAGTGGTVAIDTNGHDSSGTITVVAGTSPAASSIIFTMTFGAAFGTAPHCVISASNASAAAQSGLIFSTSSTTTATLTGGSSPLTASGTYIWNFVCLQ